MCNLYPKKIKRFLFDGKLKENKIAWELWLDNHQPSSASTAPGLLFYRYYFVSTFDQFSLMLMIIEDNFYNIAKMMMINKIKKNHRNKLDD